MSFRGAITARCPEGCEESDYEVWSFIRGDLDEPLRESLMAGDINIVRCPECGNVFRPEATVVYYDPRAEVMAFIFPESYRSDEARWRAKMHEDFEQIRGALEADGPISEEPLMFFGAEELGKILQADDDLEDEVRVARYVCEGLGYRMRPVLRSFARGRSLPRMLPSREWKEGEPFSLKETLKALRALLGKNNRLSGYKRWLSELESAKEPPPAAAAKR
ncbi:MAG: hypothetical protein HY922_05210 [Elusimicrobia bacterium]|nr:hypothetical protein [Elusimicrobiota bacterium]